MPVHHNHKCSRCHRQLKCNERLCMARPTENFTCREWSGKDCHLARDERQVER